MADQKLYCQACGAPNREQALFCGHCGKSLQKEDASTIVTSGTQPVFYTSAYYYTSTYRTMRAVAKFISAVGWVVAIPSVLVFVVGLVATISAEGEGRIVGLFLLPSFGGVLGGLLLVGFGQLTRATVDVADFTGEMLTIMKATQPPKG